MAIVTETPIASDDKSLKSDQEIKNSAQFDNPRTKLVPLVGEKTEIRCTIGGLQEDAIWDTGSQVSMVSRKWLTEHFPRSCVRPVSELSDQSTLSLTGANDSPIPYCGYTPLSLKLSGLASNLTVNVPFMVSANELTSPLIGSNVIGHLMLGDTWQEKLNNITKLGLKEEDSKVLSVQIKKLIESTRKWDVKSLGKYTVIPANQTKEIKTSVSDLVAQENRKRMIFEPREDWPLVCNDELIVTCCIVELKKGLNQTVRISVTNPTDEDKVMPRNIHLGTLEELEEVLYLETKAQDSRPDDKNEKTKVEVSQIQNRSDKVPFNQVNTETELDGHDKLHTYIKEMKLPGLKKDEADAMKEMLWQERQVFSKDPDDIGMVPDLKMSIKTQDEDPVVKNYNAIPKPLMEEVRQHVEMMFAKGWIQKSKSSW